MNNPQKGFIAIKATIEELADVRFGSIFTLSQSQRNSKCTLFRLDLDSGEKIDLTLSCVQIGLYLTNPHTKQTIDSWIKKRLEAVDCPKPESVRRAS